MRKLLALPVLAVALAFAQDLPQRIGTINDYGQTLERADRERLAQLIDALQAQDVQLVYLASWYDPFGHPARYAQEVFRAWRLGPEAVLVVFLRGEDRRWHVAVQWGDRAYPRLSQASWNDLLSQAQLEANRARPAHAVLNFASRLLQALPQGAQVTRRSFPWPYVVGGLAGAMGLLMWIRSRLCPRCWWPLQRRPSWRGTIVVCPRCRWTRALRWGRRSGSRGG